LDAFHGSGKGDVEEVRKYMEVHLETCPKNKIHHNKPNHIITLLIIL